MAKSKSFRMNSAQRTKVKVTRSNNRALRKTTNSVSRNIGNSAAEIAATVSTNKMLAEKAKADSNAKVAQAFIKNKQSTSISDFNNIIKGNPTDEGNEQTGNTPNNYGHGGGVE